MSDKGNLSGSKNTSQPDKRLTEKDEHAARLQVATTDRTAEAVVAVLPRQLRSIKLRGLLAALMLQTSAQLRLFATSFADLFRCPVQARDLCRTPQIPGYVGRHHWSEPRRHRSSLCC